MQKSKTGKISIFSSLDVKLEFLANRIELTQFSVESSRVELKIWAIRLESGWKCEQLDSISIRVQNVNSKLDLTISLIFSIWSSISKWYIINNLAFIFNILHIYFQTLKMNCVSWSDMKNLSKSWCFQI